MLDQLMISGVGSYDVYEASVAERNITPGKKKSIKETVPFSNVTYDFSNIDGELYWEEQTLEYILEIVADTPEQLEEKKTAFKNWVMKVMNEELHDPFTKDHHFIVTFSDISFDDSEVEKSTVSLSFTAYPYKIKDERKEYNFDLTATETAVIIENGSSHRIVPTFKNSVPMTVTKGGKSYTISAGETKSDSFKIEPGETTLKIKATGESGTLNIGFYEEVF